MKDDNILHIYQSNNKQSRTTTPSISIQEELKKQNIYDILEIHYRIQNLSVKSDSIIPLFEIFGTYISSRRDKIGISDCIMIYLFLDGKFSHDIEKIIIHDEVEQKFRNVILDFAENNNIKTNQYNNPKINLTLTVIKSWLRLFPHVFGAILHSAKPKENVPKSKDYLFIPMAGREYHFAELLPKINRYGVITNEPSSESILSESTYMYAVLPASIMIKSYFKQLGALISCFNKQDSFTNELQQQVITEFGISIPRTINYAAKNCLTRSNVMVALWRFLLYEHILEDCSANKVIVGGLDRSCKAALVAAERSGKKTFYLPHSITGLFHPTPPSNSLFFAPESTKIDYWKHRIRHSNLQDQNLVAVGRIDFTSINEHSRTKETKSKNINLLLATQPFADDIRHEFIKSVIESVNKSPQNINVNIKTHPSESTDFYSKYSVSNILDSDLEASIESADLVCTINSNVGAIAMAHNTPIISVNLWPWKISHPLYATFDTVPLLQSAENISNFFSTIDKRKIGEYKITQYNSFENSYSFPNGISDVISHLRSE